MFGVCENRQQVENPGYTPYTYGRLKYCEYYYFTVYENVYNHVNLKGLFGLFPPEPKGFVSCVNLKGLFPLELKGLVLM